jgi:hypothetical protein
MNCRTALSLLALSALLVGGCRGPKLVSRALTEKEAAWAATIQRSYPGWQRPYMVPTRELWQPKPAPVWDPFLPPPGTGAADSAQPSVAEPMAPATPADETVVEIVVPVPGGTPPAQAVEQTIMPPIRMDGAAPVETTADDVEFVPADDKK